MKLIKRFDLSPEVTSQIKFNDFHLQMISNYQWIHPKFYFVDFYTSLEFHLTLCLLQEFRCLKHLENFQSHQIAIRVIIVFHSKYELIKSNVKILHLLNSMEV